MVASVVIDTGSGFIKAGLAAEDESPSCVFPSCVGTAKQSGAAAMLGPAQTYCGFDAQQRHNMLDLKYPAARGKYDNWDTLETLWRHTLHDELRLDPDEPFDALLSDTPIHYMQSRPRMATTFFETFGANRLQISGEPKLNLFAAGRTTGISVDMGHSVTWAVPVFEGWTMAPAVKKAESGSNEIDDYLIMLLDNTVPDPQSHARQIKEALCWVSLDIDDDEEHFEERGLERQYEMPDGESCTIRESLICAPEIIFQPCFTGSEAPGLHEFVKESIDASEMDMRKSLWKNVVLSGGGSEMKGLPERLQQELEGIAGGAVRVDVTAEEGRGHGAWLGGSVLASLPTFDRMWVDRQEYEEVGDRIMLQKCAM